VSHAKHSRPTVDATSTLRFVRRYWLLIGLCVVVAAVAAFFRSASETNQYDATASLVFRDARLANTFFGTNQPADPNRMAATDVGLVLQRPVAVRALRALGLDRQPDDLLEHAKVEPQGVSDVAKLTVTDPDPTLAARLANSLAEQYIVERIAADRANVDAAQRAVEAQLTEVQQTAAAQGAKAAAEQEQQLRSRLNDLQLLSLLQTGNAEVVQRAERPTAPASPRPIRSGVLGGILGGIVGLLVALLLARVDRRLRDVKDVEESSELPLVGFISRSPRLAQAGTVDIAMPEFESFRMLYQQLKFLSVDLSINSLLLTSAGPSEGKTLTSMGLACAAAETGARVVLVEGDLRRPTIAARTSLQPSPGLSDALVNATAGDHVQRWMTNELGGCLDVVTAGTPPPNPAQLVQSERLHSLFEELRAAYDVMIVDTPPLGLVADALALTREVDAIVVVARLGLSQRKPFRRLLASLDQSRTPTLGIVVNGLPTDRSGHYGYHAYEQTDPKAVAQPARR
jgi:succinoglycan biosynthesis transport protein ExoP